MPICANCGARQPEGVAFCDECGAPLRSQQVPSQPVPAAGQARTVVASNVCPVCGTRTAPQDPFCSNCGAPLRDAGQTPDVARTPFQAPTPDAAHTPTAPQQPIRSQPPAAPWAMPAPSEAPTVFERPSVPPMPSEARMPSEAQMPSEAPPQPALGATIVSGQGGRGMAGAVPLQEPYRAPSGPPSVSTDEAGSRGLVCTNCGAKLEPDSAFCDMCGAPVRPSMPRSAAVPQQPPQPRTASGSQVWGPAAAGVGATEISSSPSQAQAPFELPLSSEALPPSQAPGPIPADWPGGLATSEPASSAASVYEDYTPTPSTPVTGMFVMQGTSATVPFPPGKIEMIVGREDPVRGIHPDIDLTDYGGDEGGVSRRHAQITLESGQFWIEDLDSLNHTLLNQEQLEPGHLRPLHSGDEVAFGRVKVIFRST